MTAVTVAPEGEARGGRRARPPTLARAPVRAVVVAAGLAAIGAYALAMSRAANELDYERWSTLLVGVCLAVLGSALLLVLGRREPDVWVTRCFLLALPLKLAAAGVRYLVVYDVYGGVADAAVYVEAGTELAAAYRSGDFGADPGHAVPGTGFIRIMTGIVFAVIGPSAAGGFLVFAWLGFWGGYLAFRAFRLAMPSGHHRLYCGLICLLPSMLFWSSSIGKEAWMVFALGLSAYGAARVYRRLRAGHLLLFLGLLGAFLARPHVSLLVAAAVLIGILFRPGTGRSRLGSVGTTLAAGVVIAVVAFLILERTERFLGVDAAAGSGGSVETVLDRAVRNSAQGGSGYEATPVRSVGAVPRAFVTVLFRPFPTEAHNRQALLISLESLLILGLCAGGARGVPRLLRRALREPYLVFAGAYTLMFVVAFSNLANFGIIARQRVQVLPWLLVLAVAARGAVGAGAARSGSRPEDVARAPARSP